MFLRLIFSIIFHRFLLSIHSANGKREAMGKAASNRDRIWKKELESMPQQSAGCIQTC